MDAYEGDFGYDPDDIDGPECDECGGDPRNPPEYHDGCMCD